MQLIDVWAGRVVELAAGDTVVGVGLLEVLVVIAIRQSLDEGQVACHDIGRGGRDDAYEGDGEELHYSWRWFALGEKSREFGLL